MKFSRHIENRFIIKLKVCEIKVPGHIFLSGWAKSSSDKGGNSLYANELPYFECKSSLEVDTAYLEVISFESSSSSSIECRSLIWPKFLYRLSSSSVLS